MAICSVASAMHCSFSMTNHTVYLSLGSNLGEKERNIQEAVQMIDAEVGQVLRCSSLHITEPWGFDSENTLVNAAVCCITNLTPQQVLECTADIEKRMGRTQKSVGGVYHDRIIDIDILLYDHLHLSTPQLTLPHPRMYEREFVMAPLREIMPSGKVLHQEQ